MREKIIGAGIGIQIVDLLLPVVNHLHHRLKEELLQHKKQYKCINQREQGCEKIDIQSVNKYLKTSDTRFEQVELGNKFF